MGAIVGADKGGIIAGCIGITLPIPKAAIGAGFELRGTIGATEGIPVNISSLVAR